MSGVPMGADSGHAFSGGTLSEREVAVAGGFASSAPVPPGPSRSESVIAYETEDV